MTDNLPEEINAVQTPTGPVVLYTVAWVDLMGKGFRLNENQQHIRDSLLELGYSPYEPTSFDWQGDDDD